MTREDLAGAAAGLEERQARTIAGRAEAGNVRAVELLWSTLVQKHFHYVPPLFTGRERESVRQLLRAYSAAHFLLYVRGAIREWSSLRERRELCMLSEVPSFQLFHRFHREITSSLNLMELKRAEQQEKRKAVVKQEEEYRHFTPKKSLMELFLESRKGKKNGAGIGDTTQERSGQSETVAGAASAGN